MVLSSPAFWSAVTRGVPAPQRRTIGVVVCGLIVRLGPRRWRAGGLLLSRSTVETAFYPWSARYDIVREVVLCRMAGGAQCQTPHVPPGRSALEVGSCFGFGCGSRLRILPPLWCGRLARRMVHCRSRSACARDARTTTSHQKTLSCCGAVVAPAPVTLSEGVPPTESKGPPKHGTTVRAATRCQPSGDSSARFARSE